MMAPAHWQTRRALLSWLLLPFSWVYRLLILLRVAAIKPVALPVPLFCVGNNTVGGAGKTPTVIALCGMLSAMGKHPHVISRGYKGRFEQAVLQVNPQRHDAAEVGDEPLMIAQHAPCWVAKRRMHAARAAIAAGADVIIMDDGLQNPSLIKDFSLLIVDGTYGFGNGFMMPAGPCREPVRSSMSKVDGVLIMGEETNPSVRSKIPSSLPIFTGRLIADSSIKLHDVVAHAFAGIAHPEKFFETVRQMGAQLVQTSAFADHHFFSVAELQQLINDAKSRHATLVTTEKDYVRLPAEFRNQVTMIPVSLDLHQRDVFNTLLANQVKS